MGMHVVRHVERVAVREAPLDRVAREQRRLGRAARDESEFPRDVGRIHESRIDSLSAERARHMARVAEQEAAAIGQGLGHAPVHLEVGDPAQIAEARVGADQRVDPRAKLDDARRIVARVVRVAADEKKPAIVRQRREQDEAGGADNDADGLGRNGEANLDVGDHISPAIGLADEMLVHGMAGDVMRAPAPSRYCGSTTSVLSFALSVTRRVRVSASMATTSDPYSTLTPRPAR